MNDQSPIHSDVLLREIARYLAAVEAFRGEGCEPTWRPEPTVPELRSTAVLAVAESPPSPHWTTR